MKQGDIKALAEAVLSRNKCRNNDETKHQKGETKEAVFVSENKALFQQENAGQSEVSFTEVHIKQTEAQASHEAWRITLRPVPKHVCRKLVPEEERHLRDFIKTKLVVAPRRGDTFYHMSGSDLWRLQGEYERATGFEFSMRIDFFDHYVAQATGAQVMQSPDGQVWLVGVSYC